MGLLRCAMCYSTQTGPCMNQIGVVTPWNYHRHEMHPS